MNTFPTVSDSTEGHKIGWNAKILLYRQNVKQTDAPTCLPPRASH
jgi:hypothetical protein